MSKDNDLVSGAGYSTHFFCDLVFVAAHVRFVEDARPGLTMHPSGWEQVVVIVSDWLMPDIKGDEFLTEVHARWPGIKKILLTGRANVDAVQRLTNNDSLYAMLQKPWQEDELINTIQSGL